MPPKRQVGRLHFIIGLGNPGKEYQETRHNVGFMVLDELARRNQAAFRSAKYAAVQTKIHIDNKPVLLIKPTTYMNLSGTAVQALASFYKLDDYSTMLIVVDDFHLPFGTIRLRPDGSAAGQKGLKSIIENLKTQQIPRLRIGIGNSFHSAVNHVLSPFSSSEKKDLPFVISFAADAAESFVVSGLGPTMNQFNKHILDSST